MNIFFKDGQIDNAAVHAYRKGIVAKLLTEDKETLAELFALEIVCKTIQQEMDAELALVHEKGEAAQRLVEKRIDQALDDWESRRGDWILGLRQKYLQSTKAKLPRGKGDDGRTLGDLIKQLAKHHPDEKPSELWPHLKTAIGDWADCCEERTTDKRTDYLYSHGERSKTISYKQFSERLREARNTV